MFKKLKLELAKEKEKNCTNEKYIIHLENMLRTYKQADENSQKLIKTLEKQKKHYEERTVLSESKLGRIKNAFLLNDDKEKAYDAIKSIIFGPGKHAK